MENEEGGMGSETGGDWNTSGVWDGREEIRWGGGGDYEGSGKKCQHQRGENGGQADTRRLGVQKHQRSKFRHHSNERVE